MNTKKLCTDYLPMLPIAVLIIAFSVINQQSFLKTLPTLITLVVQILLCRVNRFAFLVGGINSLIYGAAYVSEGLYFSAIFAAVVSTPIQIYSFFSWSRRQTASKQTELKALRMQMRIAVILASLAAWLALYFGASSVFANARMPLFDSFHFSMGIIVSLLSAFRYVEAQYFSAVSCITTIVMWGMICADAPGNLNYLIISCYNLYMVVKAAIRWTRQYVEPRQRKGETQPC